MPNSTTYTVCNSTYILTVTSVSPLTIFTTEFDESAVFDTPNEAARFFGVKVAEIRKLIRNFRMPTGK